MITAHTYARQLYEAAKPVAPVLVPQTYEPHCLMAWEQMVCGADDASEYALKHQEQVK